jgi:hypothetical protein
MSKSRSRPQPKTPPEAAEPTRRQVLALALLADVEPRKARRALIEGAGAIAGNDGHRIAIALDAMSNVRQSA